MVRTMILSPAALLLCLSISGYAQSVDEIIHQYIDAHGGLARLKEIQSVRMTGKMISPEGIEIPIVYMRKRPNFLRVEMTMQGSIGIQAYDGQTAWYIIPFGGNKKDPQKMTGDEMQEIVEQADFDGPLVDYQEKGNGVEFLGKEDWEETEVFRLKITSRSGHVRYLYLNAETGLEIKGSNIIRAMGAEKTVDSFFGDYQTVDGMVYAFSIVMKSGNQPGPQYTIEKIEHNVNLDDSLFKMPGSPGKN